MNHEQPRMTQNNQDQPWTTKSDQERSRMTKNNQEQPRTTKNDKNF